MDISPQQWDGLSAYLFTDRKLDTSQAKYLKSRYLLVASYLEIHQLPFNRESFNHFIASKKEQGCKHSYLNNLIKVGLYIHQYLRTYYNYDSGMDNYTYYKKEKLLFDVVTPSECRQIYEYQYPYYRLPKEKNMTFQTIFLMLTLTGMRIGEVINLKWEDVSELAIIIHNTKTDSDRIIPNNIILWDKLMQHRKYQISAYVFPGKDRGMMCVAGIDDDLKKRVKAIGIEKRVWLHLFRHSFCIEMLRNNDVTMVAKLMGHENIASTLNYTHYLLEDMRLALNTHPLLKSTQTIDTISIKLRQTIDKVIDRAQFGYSVNTNGSSFAVRIFKI